jgi:hypothetical protein
MQAEDFTFSRIASMLLLVLMHIHERKEHLPNLCTFLICSDVPTSEAKRAKTEHGDEGAGGDDGMGGMGLSAAQVANMLCEMYSSKGKMRTDHLSNVFSDKVVTSSLFSLEPMPAASGKAAIIAAYEKLGAPPAPADASA